FHYILLSVIDGRACFAQAFDLDWVKSARSSCDARRRTVPHGLRPLRRAAGRQASRCQASPRIRRCWYRGDRGGSSRRRFSLRLYGSLCDIGLCAPRVSKEVQDWASDAGLGQASDRAAAARSGSDRTRRPRMKRKIEFERSSGNVFADIGLPNSEEHLIKASLAL